MAALVPVLAACAFVTIGIAKLKSTIDRAEMSESILVVKRYGKYVPLWVTLVAWSTLGAACAFFYISRLGS
jgi:hypothetical protein